MGNPKLNCSFSSNGNEIFVALDQRQPMLKNVFSRIRSGYGTGLELSIAIELYLFHALMLSVTSMLSNIDYYFPK